MWPSDFKCFDMLIIFKKSFFMNINKIAIAPFLETVTAMSFYVCNAL